MGFRAAINPERIGPRFFFESNSTPQPAGSTRQPPSSPSSARPTCSSPQSARANSFSDFAATTLMRRLWSHTCVSAGFPDAVSILLAVCDEVGQSHFKFEPVEFRFCVASQQAIACGEEVSFNEPGRRLRRKDRHEDRPGEARNLVFLGDSLECHAAGCGS
jgi:hypothetical protein